MTKWKGGERVMALLAGGGYAEEVRGRVRARFRVRVRVGGRVKHPTAWP